MEGTLPLNYGAIVEVKKTSCNSMVDVKGTAIPMNVAFGITPVLQRLKVKSFCYVINSYSCQLYKGPRHF